MNFCINLLFDLFFRFKHLIIYCMIGCSGATLDFLLFTLLVSTTGIHYQFVNFFSTSCGIINNFFLNMYFNFKVKNHVFFRFLSFYGIGFLGILLAGACLYVFIECLAIPSILAKIFVIFIITVFQFLLNKFITFRRGDV